MDEAQERIRTRWHPEKCRKACGCFTAEGYPDLCQCGAQAMAETRPWGSEDGQPLPESLARAARVATEETAGVNEQCYGASGSRASR